MSLQKKPTNLKALSVRFDTDTQEVITIRDNVEPPFLLVFIIEWYIFLQYCIKFGDQCYDTIKDGHHFIDIYYTR